MSLQATGFIGFITVDRPTGEVQFQGLSKDVEHENGIAVFVFHLLGSLAIDGSDERIFWEDGVQKGGESGLQFLERNFPEDAGQCAVTGCSSFSKLKELLKLCRMVFGPSLDFGDGGETGDESEKDNGKSSLKRLGHALFGSGIGHVVEALDEDFEGAALGILTSMQ